MRRLLIFFTVGFIFGTAIFLIPQDVLQVCPLLEYITILSFPALWLELTLSKYSITNVEAIINFFNYLVYSLSFGALFLLMRIIFGFLKKVKVIRKHKGQS